MPGAKIESFWLNKDKTSRIRLNFLCSIFFSFRWFSDDGDRLQRSREARIEETNLSKKNKIGQCRKRNWKKFWEKNWIFLSRLRRRFFELSWSLFSPSKKNKIFTRMRKSFEKGKKKFWCYFWVILSYGRHRTAFVKSIALH